jgi:hypothetical protein
MPRVGNEPTTPVFERATTVQMLQRYDNCLIRKDLERNGRGLFEELSQHLPEGTEEKNERP